MSVERHELTLRFDLDDARKVKRLDDHCFIFGPLWLTIFTSIWIPLPQILIIPPLFLISEDMTSSFTFASDPI